MDRTSDAGAGLVQHPGRPSLAGITSSAALAALPVTRKSNLIIEKAREMKMDISSVQRAEGRGRIAGSCKLSTTIAPVACSTAALMAHRWNA